MKGAVLVAGIVAALAGGGAVACSSRPGGAGGMITGKSDTLTVHGSYAPVSIDRIDRLSLNAGKLVLHGSTSTVEVDLPSSADIAQPDPHWQLVTESNTDRERELTFTHETSLAQFTIELPPGDAPVRYGGFSGRDGNDVLVLAWGEGSRSYQGSVTIATITPPTTHD